MYSPLFGLETRFGGNGNPWTTIVVFLMVFLVSAIDGVGSSSGLRDDGEVEDDEQQASQRDVI